MNINEAYKVSSFVQEITKLENKTKWINEFLKQVSCYDKGELNFRTTDNRYYNIILDEMHETEEVAILLLDYYNNKKESLLNKIEEL